MWLTLTVLASFIANIIFASYFIFLQFKGERVIIKEPQECLGQIIVKTCPENDVKSLSN